MGLSSILVFVAAIAVATAIPGPTMVTLVGRVLATGRSGNLGFAAGLVAGDVVWLGSAVFGLAALASSAHEIITVLKYAGAAYLLFLAVRLWTVPAAPIEATAAGAPRPRWAAAFGGLAVALANPKTMMFYLALLPSLVDVTKVDLAAYGELSALLVLVYSAVLAVYMVGVLRVRRLFASPRALRRMSRCSGVVMAGAAVAVATRT